METTKSNDAIKRNFYFSASIDKTSEMQTYKVITYYKSNGDNLKKLDIIQDFLDITWNNANLNVVVPVEPTLENLSELLFSLIKEEVPDLKFIEIQKI